MHKWLWVAMMFFVASSMNANDGALLSTVIGKIKAEQWENAEAFAKHADNPMVREILIWHELRAGQGKLEDYEKFLKENADWPGLPGLQAFGEAKLTADMEHERIISYIEHHGPQTAHGLTRYIIALTKLGDTKKAREIFDEESSKLAIPMADMNEIRGMIPSINNQDVLDHVHYILNEGKTDLAKEYLETFDGDERLLLETRLDLLEDNSKARTLMKTDPNILPELIRQSPEIGFERARYAFTHKDRKQAAEIMKQFSTSASALGQAELWMRDEMRTRLAGDALWAGDAELAYELASKHFITPEEEGYDLAEWLAGFIALDFLKDPKLARTHFEHFRDVADTPITHGRAGYWLGRAGDPDGYAYGARYQTSFYGQLSAEMAGIAPDQSLLKKDDFQLSAELLSRDSIQAGLLFASADERLLARRFFAHQAETLSADEAERLGILALLLDIPDAAVNIGKNLAKSNSMIPQSLFPIPNFVPDNLVAPKALVLAVTRQESEFYQYAESPVGAKGLMQLMPETAKKTAADIGIEYHKDWLLSDSGFNMKLGASYLQIVGADYENRVPYIATGYNAGPHRVKEWIEHHGPLGSTVEEAVHWLEMIHFEETRNYVQRVLEGVYIYDAKLNGHFRLKPSELLLKPYW